MLKKGIEPMKNKVRPKSMTDQDLFERQDESSRSSVQEIFLKKRDEFYQKLLHLEFDPRVIQHILDTGIPAPDINLVIEMAQNYISRRLIESNRLQIKGPNDAEEEEINYLDEDEDGRNGQIDNPNTKLKVTPKIKQRKFNIRPKRDPEYDIPKPKVRHYEMDYLFPPDSSVFKQQTTEGNRSSPVLATLSSTVETIPTQRSKQENNPIKVDEPKSELTPSTIKKPKKKQYTFISKPPSDYLNLLSPDKIDVTSDYPICLNCNTNPITIVILIFLLVAKNIQSNIGFSSMRTCSRLQNLLE